MYKPNKALRRIFFSFIRLLLILLLGMTVRRRLAAGESQPDRAAVAQQHGEAAETDEPGKPRRWHLQPGKEPARQEDGRDSLQQVDQQYRQRRSLAERPQHVGRAGRSRTVFANVYAAQQPAREIARGDRAQEIGGGNAADPEERNEKRRCRVVQRKSPSNPFRL